MLLRVLVVAAAAASMSSVAQAQTANDRVSEGFENLPAVSAINSKVDISGFVNESGSPIGSITGAITFPLTHSFGLQIDGAGSFAQDLNIYGAAAHLFWRDPTTALIGIYGSASRADFSNVGGGGGLFAQDIDVGSFSQLSAGAATGDLTIDVVNIATEVELYLDRFSLEGMAGASFVDSPASLTTIDDVYLLGNATLAYYITDDLRVDAGWRHGVGGHTGSVGFEWQAHSHTSAGYSGFAQAQVGEGGEVAAVFGLRLYWGDDKTLIERHRLDDPAIFLRDEFSQIERLEVEGGAGGTGGTCPSSNGVRDLQNIVTVDSSIPGSITNDGVNSDGVHLNRMTPAEAASMVDSFTSTTTTFEDGDVICGYSDGGIG